MHVTFPKILDLLFVISIITVFITALSTAITAASYAYKSGFLVFFSVFVPGIVGVIVAFGTIYVLLDIRDNLQKKNQ